jgi:hypothetical protein
MMRRRRFLAGLGPLATAAAAVLRPAPLLAAEPFNVLGPADITRLKLDFNSNKGKVRLVFMLSPT